MNIYTYSTEQTEKLGRLIGKHLLGMEVLLLVGELGTGKTTLVRGIAKGLDIAGIVSPSFVVVRSYTGKHRLHHIDLYRIDEDKTLNLEEYLFNKDVVVVEWADKLRIAVDGIRVHLYHCNTNTRIISIEDSQIERLFGDNFSFAEILWKELSLS